VYKTTYLNETWHARYVHVNDVTYDVLRERLLVNNATTEKEALMRHDDVFEVVSEQVLEDPEVRGVRIQGLLSSPPARLSFVVRRVNEG
jgi:hypothetical protein